MKLLIENGANTNAVNAENNTALISAITAGMFPKFLAVIIDFNGHFVD